MNRYLTVALIAAVALSLVPTAEAKTTWDLSGYGGYIANDKDVTDGSGWGVRLGAFAMVKPTFGIGLEGSYNWLGSADIDSILEPETMVPTRGEMTIYSLIGTGSAKWQPQLGSFRPFVIGGAGIYSMTYQLKLETGFREDVNRKKFGFNLGAGVAWVPKNSPISIGLDARWNSVSGGKATPEQIQQAIDTGVPAEGSTLNYGTIFLGVTYNTNGTP